MITDVPFPRLLFYFICLLLVPSILFSSNVFANPRPAIAIIIDDMGYHYQRDVDAINLPGELTFSILPHTPYAQPIAAIAHTQNKEVMLHLPMESISHQYQERDELKMDMDKEQLNHLLAYHFAAVPHAVGINNHMGSLLTQHPGHMQWIMEFVHRQNMFFVDSYTTEKSIVRRIANEHWVPTIRRDIFLDNDRNPQTINLQFDRLLTLARKNGVALAIGHPYPQTLALLRKRLHTLTQNGYELVSVSKLIEKYNMQRYKKWRVFLSP